MVAATVDCLVVIKPPLDSGREVITGLTSCPSGSVTVMLQDLNWDTLSSRRQTSRLCLLYKILHNIVDVTLPSYIIPSTRLTRGHDHKFILPQSRIEFNFFPNLIRLWNNIPIETVHAHTIDRFCNIFYSAYK